MRIWPAIEKSQPMPSVLVRDLAVELTPPVTGMVGPWVMRKLPIGVPAASWPRLNVAALISYED